MFLGEFAHLIISRSFDVLAVVAPVSGWAESLGAEFAVKYSTHLDAVLSIVDVRAVCVILKCGKPITVKSKLPMCV